MNCIKIERREGGGGGKVTVFRNGGVRLFFKEVDDMGTGHIINGKEGEGMGMGGKE